MNLPSEVIEVCGHDKAPLGPHRIDWGGSGQCPGVRRFRIEEVIHMDFNEPLFRLVEVTDGD